VLLRLAYLGVTNALAMPRLLPMNDQAKDTEIPPTDCSILASSHRETDIPRLPEPWGGGSPTRRPAQAKSNTSGKARTTVQAQTAYTIM
jgi:hypothetical protein